jgi:hypothetical protein
MVSIGPDFLNRIAPNTHMIFGLQSAQGSESLVHAPYARLLKASRSERFDFEQVDPDAALMDLMAVRWLAATVPVQSEGWNLEGLLETRLYSNEEAVPRAFVPSGVEPMAGEDAVLKAITGGDDPHVARIVGGEPWTAEERPELEVTEYEANYVLVSGAMHAGSWMVLADVAYPGWRAYADEHERSIVPADLVRRAVRLDHEANELRFIYMPASFRLGMFGTMVALALLSALVGALMAGRQRR